MKVTFAGNASQGAEPAFESPSPMGKRKVNGPAGEDSCAEESIGSVSGAAASNAAAGPGISPQCSRRRCIRQATVHEADREGSTAGEPSAPAAGGESLAQFMVPRAPDAQPYGVRSVRIEDIVTIEDASLVAREHSAEIPGELFRRVWEVRAELNRHRLRELARTYSIRRKWQKQKQTFDESPDWVQYAL